MMETADLVHPRQGKPNYQTPAVRVGLTASKRASGEGIYIKAVTMTTTPSRHPILIHLGLTLRNTMIDCIGRRQCQCQQHPSPLSFHFPLSLRKQPSAIPRKLSCPPLILWHALQTNSPNAAQTNHPFMYRPQPLTFRRHPMSPRCSHRPKRCLAHVHPAQCLPLKLGIDAADQ